MGHLASKDVYRDLGRTIDGLSARAPWNETLRSILRELYTEEEADLVVRMPTGLASPSRIHEVTGMEVARLNYLLERLAVKGLVMDLEIGGETQFNISPLVIGIFEFTMMRRDGDVNLPRLAGLFKEYMNEAFYRANCGQDMKVSVMRTIPHVESIDAESRVEVLDYEKANELVDQGPGAAVGICSCRHEKLHLGEKHCEVPLEMCINFATDSSFIVKRNLARSVSKSELKELLAQAKELKLVLNADNVRKGVQFICTCCKCCCNVLAGVRDFGYPNTLITSRFIASWKESLCKGCGKCAQACPIDAIQMIEPDPTANGKGKKPRVDTAYCLGCGVCGLACATHAMVLIPREQRVLMPENTLERVVLQSLERGTLQNLLFNNPNLASQRFLRAVVGVFLSLPPVKRYMMGDAFRSKFLARMAS